MSFDNAKPILSHIYQALYTTSTSTLFKEEMPFCSLPNLFNNMLDLPPSNHEKIDDKPVDKFLLNGICCHIGIKVFCLNKQTFVNIFGRLLYIW